MKSCHGFIFLSDTVCPLRPRYELRPRIPDEISAAEGAASRLDGVRDSRPKALVAPPCDVSTELRRPCCCCGNDLLRPGKQRSWIMVDHSSPATALKAERDANYVHQELRYCRRCAPDGNWHN